MATAGSLVVNVAADASKLEAGFKRARGMSKGFAADTIADLRSIDKMTSKFGKGMMGLGDAKSIGSLLGYGAGGLAGGAIGGMAADAAWSAVSAYIERAEKGAALITAKLNEAEAAGKRLEGIDLISANQVRNAQQIWEALRGKDDGGVGAAVGMAPMKEALGAGILESQAKLAELAKGMQAAWDKIPGAIRGAIPGAEGMAAAMQKAADFGADIAKTSREHAEATAKAAQLQAQINQRAFRPVAAEADAGMAWIKDAAAQAQMNLDIVEADRNQRAFAQRVTAEQDRLAGMQSRFTDPGGTAALMAGSSGEFSARQKALRAVEFAASAKSNPAERDAKQIAEKMLKAEEEQLKKLDKVVDELRDLPRLKVFKF